MKKKSKKKAVIGSMMLSTTVVNAASVGEVKAYHDITTKKLKNTILSSKRYAKDTIPAISALIASAICPIGGYIQLLSFIYTTMAMYDESYYKKLYNFTDEISTGVKEKINNIREKLNGNKNASKTSIQDDINSIKNNFNIVLKEYVRLKIKERIKNEYEECNKLEEFKKLEFPIFIEYKKKTNNKIDEISKIITDRLLYEKGIYNYDIEQSDDDTDSSILIKKVFGYIKSPFENILNKKDFLKKIMELDELIEEEITALKNPKRKNQKKE